MELPADSHVHSEYSWDAATDPASVRLMRRTCERACRIGLSTLIFTEHLDFEDHWRAEPADLDPHERKLIDATGHVRLPAFDLTGYLESIDRCRHTFPELRILTGVEFGQPHLWDGAAADIIGSGEINRVNGSLHMLPYGDTDRAEPITLYRNQDPTEVMSAYLEEIPRMVAGSDTFAVFTHIDYAVRTWPTDTAGPFEPSVIAANFPEAAAMLEHFGFRAGTEPEDFWVR